MTVLSNIAIQNLSQGPNPLIHSFDATSLQGASYDMRAGSFIKAHSKTVQLIDQGTMEIAAGEVVEIITLEELEIPDNHCAYVFPINSLSSQGLLVLNPGHIDPNFKGPLSVKAINLKKTSYTIHHGDPVFTIVFHSLDKKTSIPQKSSYNFTPVARTSRERNAQKSVNANSVLSISEVVDFGGKYVSENHVKNIIRLHWSNKVNTFLTYSAVILALIGAYGSFAGIIKDNADLQIKKSEETMSKKIISLENKISNLEKINSELITTTRNSDKNASQK